MIGESRLFAAVVAAQEIQTKTPPDIMTQVFQSPVFWSIITAAGCIFGGWVVIARFMLKSSIEALMLAMLKDEKGPFIEFIVKSAAAAQEYKAHKALTEKNADEIRRVKSTVNSMQSQIQKSYEQKERISEQLKENKEQMQRFELSQQAFSLQQKQLQRDIKTLSDSNLRLDQDTRDTNKQLSEMNGNIQRLLGIMSKDQGLS